MHLVFIAFGLERSFFPFFSAFAPAVISGVLVAVAACSGLCLAEPLQLCQTSFRTPAGSCLLPALRKLRDWETSPVILASCHSKAEIALHL